MVLVETIHDTPSLGKESPMMIQLSFSIFLAQLDKMTKSDSSLTSPKRFIAKVNKMDCEAVRILQILLQKLTDERQRHCLTIRFK